MTAPATQSLLPVTQEIREQAAQLLGAQGKPRLYTDDVRRGLHDHGPTVQWFARHRSSSTASSVGAGDLRAHFTRMMEAAANYLEPTTYIARHPHHGLNGPCRFTTEFPMPDDDHSDSAKADINGRRDQAFIRDMIYMLDGPEQRAALAASSHPSISDAPGVNCPGCGGCIATACPHCGAERVNLDDFPVPSLAGDATLRRYVQHLPVCRLKMRMGDKCDCGLDDVRRTKQAAKPTGSALPVDAPSALSGDAP